MGSLSRKIDRRAYLMGKLSEETYKLRWPYKPARQAKEREADINAERAALDKNPREVILHSTKGYRVRSVDA